MAIGVQPYPMTALEALPEIDRRILRLVAEGRSSKEIAKTLDRSPLTIDSRLKDVCARLGAETRAHAASMLMRWEAGEAPPQNWGPQPARVAAASVVAASGEEVGGRPGASRSNGAQSADPFIRIPVGDLMALIRGGPESEPRAERLARILKAVFVIAAVLALIAFFLASAITAFQETFRSLLRG